MLYKDTHPSTNLEYLKTLEPISLTNYVRGYLMACEHMRDAFIQGRIQFLTEALGHKQDSPDFAHFISLVALLDHYEDMVEDKEEILRKFFPELNL